jgi:hypothetical protein
MTEVRPETESRTDNQHQLTTATPVEPESARQTPTTRGSGSDPVAARHRTRPSSTTILLSVAGVLAAALYVGALVVLTDAAASASKLQSWGGPAALSAMIVMYAIIAGFVLLFTAAFRATDKS